MFEKIIITNENTKLFFKHLKNLIAHKTNVNMLNSHKVDNPIIDSFGRFLGIARF